MRAKNTSKIKGVSFSKHNRKWKAQIRIDGRVQHICYSDNEIEAGNRYQEMKERTKAHTHIWKRSRKIIDQEYCISCPETRLIF